MLLHKLLECQEPHKNNLLNFIKSDTNYLALLRLIINGVSVTLTIHKNH